MPSDDAKQSTASGLRVLPGDARPSSQPAKPKTPRPRASRYGEGEVIADKYLLKRKLGEGGMGEVWLAHNATLDIGVAIKLIRADVATPEMADRLLHEARAAARLGHPAIVRVNDFGKTAKGDPYIVMELLEGEDLASALAQKGRLSAIKAVRTLLPICSALTAAHTKGIVHRDLKPENIFLATADDGHVHPKLVDFGVAKLEKQHSDRLTQSGALLGSPLYMSPEQARGDDVDHRADIWALAVVLYESITGRPPFEGKNYNAILYSIIANPPTPITDLMTGDADLWSILERAMQKDPDRRWYSIRDLGEALARWLEDRQIHEDISGASLQSTWLQWKRDDDVLSAGPSAPPPIDGSAPLPPLPPLPQLGPVGRQRVTTVRRPRPASRPIVLGIAAVALGLVIVAGAPLASRSEGPHATSPALPAARETSAPLTPTGEPDPTVDPAHERAIEEALASPPPTASASASSPHPSTPHPSVTKPATVAAPRSPKSNGIYTTDPYGPRRRKPLKDPFR